MIACRLIRDITKNVVTFFEFQTSHIIIYMSEPTEFTVGLMKSPDRNPLVLPPKLQVHTETSSTPQITPPDIIFETITLGLRQEGHLQMLLATYQGAHWSN